MAPLSVVVVQPFSLGHLGLGRQVAAVMVAVRAVRVKRAVVIIFVSTGEVKKLTNIRASGGLIEIYTHMRGSKKIRVEPRWRKEGEDGEVSNSYHGSTFRETNKPVRPINYVTTGC
jgi:hypothetical protein